MLSVLLMHYLTASPLPSSIDEAWGAQMEVKMVKLFLRILVLLERAIRA
jgi:hypothetical protein